MRFTKYIYIDEDSVIIEESNTSKRDKYIEFDIICKDTKTVYSTNEIITIKIYEIRRKKQLSIEW